MTMGPLMLDLDGLVLTGEEARLLADPAVGGVILFQRNIDTLPQLQALIGALRQRRPELIIAVDQEGGRVQRVRDGVTRLPALAGLGRVYRVDAARALRDAREWGWLMAAEMLALGFDISFAPVLDLDHGRSVIIGDRAFGQTPDQVVALATAYVQGMAEAGMAATGKHFPGHGWVRADSHVAIPVDERPWPRLDELDLVPFKKLAGQLQGIMPAHVIYAAIDPQPAGFSRYWLQEILRRQLAFSGVIFSDDLSMEGASVAGDYVERARQALHAGCDMVLVCNNRSGALAVRDWLNRTEQTADQARLERLRAHQPQSLEALKASPRWQACQRMLQSYVTV